MINDDVSAKMTYISGNRENKPPYGITDLSKIDFSCVFFKMKGSEKKYFYDVLELNNEIVNFLIEGDLREKVLRIGQIVEKEKKFRCENENIGKRLDVIKGVIQKIAESFGKKPDEYFNKYKELFNGDSIEKFQKNIESLYKEKIMEMKNILGEEGVNKVVKIFKECRKYEVKFFKELDLEEIPLESIVISNDELKNEKLMKNFDLTEEEFRIYDKKENFPGFLEVRCSNILGKLHTIPRLEYLNVRLSKIIQDIAEKNRVEFFLDRAKKQREFYKRRGKREIAFLNTKRSFFYNSY